MKSLVTGITGQLGHDVLKELIKRGYTDVLPIGRNEMNIEDKEQVEEIITNYKPDIIFHCAAYTAVDKAEEEKEACAKVNVEGTKYIAEAAKKVGSKLIYISSDYVFDGTKNSPYEITDTPNPKSIYGLTKYKGELEALKNDKTFVVRTSWVFGINNKNFVKTMLNQVGKRTEVNVVNDQIGSPTYTVDLARLLVDMALTDKYGIYQAHNEGYISWYDFACAIFKTNGIDMKVNAIPTSAYPTEAQRPLYSAMSTSSIIENGFTLLPTWEDALERYKEELIKENVLIKK
jgi:dTDP-4-dehydrorhamnose reductase